MVYCTFWSQYPRAGHLVYIFHEMTAKHSNTLELFTTTYRIYWVASTHVRKIMLGTTHGNRLATIKILAVYLIFIVGEPDCSRNVARVQPLKVSHAILANSYL